MASNFECLRRKKVRVYWNKKRFFGWSWRQIPLEMEIYFPFLHSLQDLFCQLNCETRIISTKFKSTLALYQVSKCNGCLSVGEVNQTLFWLWEQRDRHTKSNGWWFKKYYKYCVSFFNICSWMSATCWWRNEWWDSIQCRNDMIRCKNGHKILFFTDKDV